MRLKEATVGKAGLGELGLNIQETCVELETACHLKGQLALL
jgi:hypothetical protein